MATVSAPGLRSCAASGAAGRPKGALVAVGVGRRAGDRQQKHEEAQRPHLVQPQKKEGLKSYT